MSIPEREQSIYVPGPPPQQFGHPSTWPAAQPPPAPPSAPTRQPYRASTKSRVVAWSIAVILLGSLAGLIGYSVYGASADPDTVKQSSRKLIAACHAAVEARLKAPSTARYSSESVAGLTGTRWKVSGSVDAQNGFGAMLRQGYSCEADRVGDDWKVASVYFTN